MTFNLCFKAKSFILAVALLIGLGLVTHASAQQHSFLVDLNTRTVTELRALGGSPTHASAINDAGQVAGWTGTAGIDMHAFITGPDGIGMRGLGTLGGDLSGASDINNAGQVVGWSEAAEDVRRAFITDPDGRGMMDLNSLVDLPEGVILTEAIDINNNGQVIAMGVIPEPEAYALMLAGLGLVGFMARRKKTAGRVSTIEGF